MPRRAPAPARRDAPPARFACLARPRDGTRNRPWAACAVGRTALAHLLCRWRRVTTARWRASGMMGRGGRPCQWSSEAGGADIFCLDAAGRTPLARAVARDGYRASAMPHALRARVCGMLSRRGTRRPCDAQRRHGMRAGAAAYGPEESGEVRAPMRARMRRSVLDPGMHAHARLLMPCPRQLRYCVESCCVFELSAPRRGSEADGDALWRRSQEASSPDVRCVVVCLSNAQEPAKPRAQL